MSFCYLTRRYEIRDIPEHPGYLADSMGMLWRRNPETGALVPVRTWGVAYRTMAIKRRSFHVHRLVASAFHGMKPDWATECRHLNDVKKDNRPENLAWGTRFDNEHDYFRLNGTAKRWNKTGGIQHRKAEVVALIRQGVAYDKIAELTGVSRTSVFRIKQEMCPEIRRLNKRQPLPPSD
ncbi:unnamed protein product [uncultured bacterium]|nr:unnamed protein product [uncultured bacterium]